MYSDSGMGGANRQLVGMGEERGAQFCRVMCHVPCQCRGRLAAILFAGAGSESVPVLSRDVSCTELVEGGMVVISFARAGGESGQFCRVMCRVQTTWSWGGGGGEF